MFKYLIMIGVSNPAMYGKDFLNTLADLADGMSINMDLLPSSNFIASSKPAKCSLSVNVDNLPDSSIVTKVIKLNQLANELEKGDYVSFTIAKVYNGNIVDAWTVNELRTVDYLCTDDRAPIATLVMDSSFYKLDRSLSTLWMLNSIDSKPVGAERDVVFYDIPGTKEEVTISSINKAMEEADKSVTNPEQKTFLQRLREMIGV